MSVQELVDIILKAAVQEKKVVIFSKSWCPYCKKAKGVFADEFPDVETTVYELDERKDGQAIQDYLLEKTNQRTVPNVFVSSDDVKKALNNGKLRQLLNA
ncbi:hypothetical protein H0H92_008113 [Tricholoma furcatifolium]|nr:hypothetical protein H0H92_008113 [Tricholoma furcatifolium]